MVIVDLPTPTLLLKLHDALGHTSYYKKIMHNYATISTPLEKLLKKEAQFVWEELYQNAFDQLKEKLVSMPILIFPYWNKFFNVHIDASSVIIGTIFV